MTPLCRKIKVFQIIVISPLFYSEQVQIQAINELAQSYQKDKLDL